MAIYTSNTTIDSSRIFNNSARNANGGGIYLTNYNITGFSDTTSIRNTLIYGNKVTENGKGGGIQAWVESGDNYLSIINSTIVNLVVFHQRKHL